MNNNLGRTTFLIMLAGIVSIFATITMANAQIPSTGASPNSVNGTNIMPMNNNTMMRSMAPDIMTTNGWSSSVSIFQPLISAFKSAIKVNINDAITAAENSVGSNSTTIAAFIHPENQFIVYNVFTLDPTGTIHRILVDPGNGKILFDEKMSFIEMMKLVHGGIFMKQNGMMGPGMGMSGHEGMMGPGMGMSGHEGMMGPGMGMSGHEGMMGPGMGMSGHEGMMSGLIGKIKSFLQMGMSSHEGMMGQ